MRNQILHIFRKDVRQHWWEIVASLGMAMAYAWNESRHDIGSGFFLVQGYGFPGVPMLAPLLVIAWALVIVRGIEGESPAGDRQFWVTRPYDWKQLLGAKVLFVVVFVNVPLFAVQAFLLWRAGFSPAMYISGLLRLQAPWVLILILPVAALAALTPNIGRFMLAVLGVLVYFAAIAGLGSLGQDAVPPRAGSVPMTLDAVILAGTCAAVVLWQYGRRRTGKARLLLLAALGAAPIILFAAPYGALIAHAYPQVRPGQLMPVQLAFDQAKLNDRERGYPEKDKVHVQIPLLVSGIRDAWMVFVEGTMAGIEGPGGVSWHQGWRGSGSVLLPNRERTHIVINIDTDFFERVKQIPVKLRMTFALAPRHAKKTFQKVAQANQFPVDGGRCAVPRSPFEALVCTFPLKAPFVLVSARADEITCAPQANQVALPGGETGYGWTTAAGAGITPVESFQLWLLDWGFLKRETLPAGARICPGTRLTFFTNWEDAQPIQSNLEIDGIRLADYQLSDVVTPD